MIKDIKLRTGQVYTYYQIYSILDEARMGFGHAKFTSSNGKTYITVNFNRDFSISISTNSRDYLMYIESQIIVRDNGPFSRIAQFLFKWLPIINNN